MLGVTNLTARGPLGRPIVRFVFDWNLPVRVKSEVSYAVGGVLLTLLRLLFVYNIDRKRE